MTSATFTGYTQHKNGDKINFMTIYNRLKILIAEKEIREGRSLPYRVIFEETGIAKSTLTDYAKQRVTRFDASTLNTLCRYFDCQPGDLLVYSKSYPRE